MPRSNVSPTDVYMQFFPIMLDAATGDNVEDLLSADFNTGLSIRGEYFWLIHKVEWHFLLKAILVGLGAGWHGAFQFALSTRSGLTVMPQPEDPGVVAYMRHIVSGIPSTTDEIWFGPLTFFDTFSPSLPLAAPKLNIYLQGVTGAGTAPDWVAGRKLTARIGFTTAPLTSQMYDEIAETWAYNTY